MFIKMSYINYMSYFGSNLGLLCNESAAITSTSVLSGVKLPLFASIPNLLIFILI